MKTKLILAATGIAAMHLAAAPVDWSKLPPAAKTDGVTFANNIQPLFKESCVRCHGAERPKAQLRLDTLEGVLKGTKKGSIFTAGDSAHSLLVKAVSQLDPETAMPPKPRAPRRGPGGPQGTNAPAMQPREGGSLGGPEGDHGPGGPPPGAGEGSHPAGGPRNFGPPAKPLTPEQVGLVRAWIDQGAK
jgi:hypothetical protein